MSKSRAIVFPQINQVVVEQYDPPDLRPDEIRVATEYSGISQGTEIWALAGKRPELTYPTVPGYQSVGIIEEVGTGVTGYHAGQRVLFNTSRLPEQFPRTWMGGHVSRAVVPVRADGHPVLLSEDADPVAASLAYLPAVSLRGIRMIDISIGDVVVVTGQGLIGQASAQLARLRGAIVVATDLSATRRSLSTKCSADFCVNPAEQNLNEVVRSLKSTGADAVIETTGRSDQVTPCIDLLRWEGQLLLQGYYPEPINFNFHDTHMKKPRLAVTCGCDSADAGICIRLMQHRKLDFRGLVTDVIPIAEAPRIYSQLAAGNERMLGVVFDWRKQQ